MSPSSNSVVSSKSDVALLHLDSSPRRDDSISRKMSAYAVGAWLQRYPNHQVTSIDLLSTLPSLVTGEWIQAAKNPESKGDPALKESDRWIDLLEAHDHWVLGVPMHNLSVPSVFKAWIDQIVRLGRTYTENFEGMLHQKQVLIVTARGGVYTPGTPWANYDFQEPYLRALFGVLGVRDLTFIHCEGTQSDSQIWRKNLEQCHCDINSWADRIANA